VARQTRDERRRRRAESGADGPTGQQPPRRPEVDRPLAEPAHAAEPRRTHFLAESWAELRKVEWPRQPQVIQGTIVVLVACIVVGVYLWGADQIFSRLVQRVLLR
jgi:preprotein translocase subunit SecE